jgi:RimJ/RimL family protein N-acetyltransferase
LKRVLVTPRLALRELQPEDLDFVAGMLGDVEVMRHYPKPLDRAGAAGWIERQRQRYARDGHGLWLVLERVTGEPLGQVGVLEQEVGDKVETEVGYLIARPHWRRGYAIEAARACRDWAFTTLGRHHVISLIRPENLPSQAVARANGMALERTLEWRGLTHHVFGTSRPD